MTDTPLPEWLSRQIGLKYRERSTIHYMRRGEIIRKYLLERQAEGKATTSADVRLLLASLKRNYSLEDNQISALLAPFVRSGLIRAYSNAIPVWVNGKRYRSIRQAARAEGVHMEIARRRCQDPTRDDWTCAQPPESDN